MQYSKAGTGILNQYEGTRTRVEHEGKLNERLDRERPSLWTLDIEAILLLEASPVLRMHRHFRVARVHIKGLRPRKSAQTFVRARIARSYSASSEVLCLSNIP